MASIKSLTVLKLLKGVQSFIGLQDNVAAVATIAAIRTAVRRKFLASKRNDSVAPIPRTDMNNRGINQLTITKQDLIFSMFIILISRLIVWKESSFRNESALNA